VMPEKKQKSASKNFIKPFLALHIYYNLSYRLS
jgi:hypothetical protein